MKKYILTIAVLALGAVSCNILDTKPESSLDKDSFFQEETNLKLFSEPFYQVFEDNAKFYQAQSDHIVTKNLSHEIQGNREIPQSGNGWNFNLLRRMNNLLMYIGTCPNDRVRHEYTAVARFFRAAFYFEKVKRFGDVPWVDRAYEDSDPELQNPRDSREFVIHKMLEDLDYAIDSLPATSTVYRINQNTAHALKAQVCLYEGTFRKYHAANISTDPATPWTADYETSSQLLQMAADEAKIVMDCGKYKLKDDYLMLFAEPDADKDEMIIALRFESAISRKNNTSAFAIMATQGMPGLTKKYVDSFLMKDGSRFTDQAGWETMGFMDEVADRDPRLACLTRTPGYTRIGKPNDVLAPDYGSSCTGFQLVKFVMDATLENVDRVDMSYNDLPVIRLGEIYLIYAEALAELGTLTQGDLDISVNKLRARVGMPDMNMAAANANPDPYLLSAEYGYSNPVLTGAANKGVILEIRRERAVELGQEGRRYDDLMRWKEGACLNQAIYGPYFAGAGKYDLTGDGKEDLVLYVGDEKPKDKVQVYRIDGDSPSLILSEGTSGYVEYHKGIGHNFNESRDYLYPIPTDERQLNNNLTQNPGWADGFDF